MNIRSYQRAHTVRLDIEQLAILHLPRIVCCGGMVELGRQESSAECHGASRSAASRQPHRHTACNAPNLEHVRKALIATILSHYITRVLGPIFDQFFWDYVLEYDWVKQSDQSPLKRVPTMWARYSPVTALPEVCQRPNDRLALIVRVTSR